jgi:hypothetical protein
MKKLNIELMSSVNGGLKCGTVGALTGLAFAAILVNPVGAIGSLFGLSSNIRNCWNS